MNIYNCSFTCIIRINQINDQSNLNNFFSVTSFAWSLKWNVRDLHILSTFLRMLLKQGLLTGSNPLHILLISYRVLIGCIPTNAFSSSLWLVSLYRRSTERSIPYRDVTENRNTPVRHKTPAPQSFHSLGMIVSLYAHCIIHIRQHYCVYCRDCLSNSLNTFQSVSM